MKGVPERTTTALKTDEGHTRQQGSDPVPPLEPIRKQAELPIGVPDPPQPAQYTHPVPSDRCRWSGNGHEQY